MDSFSKSSNAILSAWDERGRSGLEGTHFCKLKPSGIDAAKQFETAAKRFFVGTRNSFQAKLPCGSAGTLPWWLYMTLTALLKASKACCFWSSVSPVGRSCVAPANWHPKVLKTTLSTYSAETGIEIRGNSCQMPTRDYIIQECQSFWLNFAVMTHVPQRQTPHQSKS